MAEALGRRADGRPENVQAGAFVVFGASGAGKTVAVRALERRRLPGVRCFFFDSIGVPAGDVMQREFGGGEGWQAHATRSWLRRLAQELSDGEVGVLEGQTRPSFVASSDAGSLIVRMLLLECDRSAREARLLGRGQPELADERMERWAVYLRGQADALGLSVVDTTEMTVDDVASEIADRCKLLRAELTPVPNSSAGADRSAP